MTLEAGSGKDPQDPDHRRTEDDDEHGREDEEDRWEEDLETCLLGPLLGRLAPFQPERLGVDAEGLDQAGPVAIGLDDDRGQAPDLLQVGALAEEPQRP